MHRRAVDHVWRLLHWVAMHHVRVHVSRHSTQMRGSRVSGGNNGIRAKRRNELRRSDLNHTGCLHIMRWLRLRMRQHNTPVGHRLLLLLLLWWRPLDHSALFAHVQLRMILECTLGTGPSLLFLLHSLRYSFVGYAATTKISTTTTTTTTTATAHCTSR